MDTLMQISAASLQQRAFGDLLRRHRRAALLTQEALAERAGLSVRGLQHLEAGEVLPFHATLRALVDALDLQGDFRARLETAGRRWTA